MGGVVFSHEAPRMVVADVDDDDDDEGAGE